MDLISTYANGVSELTKFSHAEEQRPLVVDVIVNPHAGFFKSQAALSHRIRELESRLADLRARSPRRQVEINTVHFTERPGHARLITEGILEREGRNGTGIERLLIACGGDGTSNEICSALVGADAHLLDRLKLLRLPLGTGNDVADATTFEGAYNLILGRQDTLATGALEVTFGPAPGPGSAGRQVRYAFNIASIGLDAFIVELTSKLKRVIPGDAYRSVVDVASLFYEQKVKPQPMDIRISSDWGESQVNAFVPSMVVMGVSGRRTYGGHLHVLPGEENVCLVSRMGFLDKIRNKKLFYEGRHGQLPWVSFHRGQRVEVEYRGRIPLQLDGELVWLAPQDFPIRMDVLPPRIKVLKAAAAAPSS
ncbi:MAG TPA: diacylglycerol kinase family protein [Spirochaetia bacterium]|nr:diacylglycerol kinase family protein [Spirochaetia bacterium]